MSPVRLTGERVIDKQIKSVKALGKSDGAALLKQKKLEKMKLNIKEM